MLEFLENLEVCGDKERNSGISISFFAQCCSYMKKKLLIKTKQNCLNDYYNIEGNTFLSIYFLFTSKLKSNCSCLKKHLT